MFYKTLPLAAPKRPPDPLASKICIDNPFRIDCYLQTRCESSVLETVREIPALDNPGDTS